MAAQSTALGNWLADKCTNLYGVSAGAHNLNGKTNSEIAVFLMSLYNRHQASLDGQVLATALHIYATTSSLGGKLGKKYGFRVNSLGAGASLMNVAGHGHLFAVPNNTRLTMLQALRQVDAQSSTGVLFYGNQAKIAEATKVFPLVA